MKPIITVLSTGLLVTLSLGLLTATPAIAQTTDVLPDENVGVCDGLKAPGTTKGLYGLCIAFCVAQAITSVDTEITEEALSALEDSAPSGKILRNYNKRKSESDPAMPCIKVEEPCPCWSAGDIENLMGGAADGVAWCQVLVDGTNPTTGEIDGLLAIDLDHYPDPTGVYHMAAARDQHRAGQGPGRESCYYQEPVTGPSGGLDTPRSFSVAAGTLTHEQAATCLAQVKATCEVLGIR